MTEAQSLFNNNTVATGSLQWIRLTVESISRLEQVPSSIHPSVIFLGRVDKYSVVWSAKCQKMVKMVHVPQIPCLTHFRKIQFLLKWD